MYPAANSILRRAPNSTHFAQILPDSRNCLGAVLSRCPQARRLALGAMRPPHSPQSSRARPALRGMESRHHAKHSRMHNGLCGRSVSSVLPASTGQQLTAWRLGAVSDHTTHVAGCCCSDIRNKMHTHTRGLSAPELLWWFCRFVALCPCAAVPSPCLLAPAEPRCDHRTSSQHPSYSVFIALASCALPGPPFALLGHEAT